MKPSIPDMFPARAAGERQETHRAAVATAAEAPGRLSRFSPPGTRRAVRQVTLLGILVLLTALLIPLISAKELFDQQLLQRIETKYGKDARLRLENLVTLVTVEARGKPEDEKLQHVNNFFNQVPFIDDIIHWGKEDYWATPVEKLATFGGDCEDFSIAKYFALKQLGVPEDKLRLTYVKAIRLNQAHMVLTYFPEPTAMPLVLDNLVPGIRPAVERRDLVPVYSFNGDGLWLAKARGSGKRVGSSTKLSLWTDLMTRMDNSSL